MRIEFNRFKKKRATVSTLKTSRPIEESQSFIIENASIITPYRVIENGSLSVKAGRIDKIVNGEIKESGERIDVNGQFVMPGLIDLSCNAHAIMKRRPGTVFPYDITFMENDRNLASWGITTIYYTIDFYGDKRDGSGIEQAKNIIKEIYLIASLFKTRLRIHARCDVSRIDWIPAIRDLIKERKIHLLSFADRGVKKSEPILDTALIAHYRYQYGFSKVDAEKYVEQKKQDPRDFEHPQVKELIRFCQAHHVPLITYGDNSAYRIEMAFRYGMRICQFPQNTPAALAATRHRMGVMLSAPSIVRDSTEKNSLCALKTISSGLGDILYSDDTSMTLLQAIFTLSDEKILSLPKAVNMGTDAPAVAIGRDDELGSIALGKRADLIMVKRIDGVPIVTSTWIDGENIQMVPG